MDNHGIIDICAATGLFLFTGAEVMSMESTIFEIISKFGVVAVLWFWLRDMKTQMKEMLTTFEKESAEQRSEHEKEVLRMQDSIKQRDQQLKDLHTQLINKNANK